MNLKALRIQKGIQQKELAERIGADEPTLSKLENFRFLPTPTMMERLCKALDCRISDLYEKTEITYCDVIKRVERSAKPRSACYNLSARMPIELKNDLQVALSLCGYHSTKEWLLQCTEDLRARAKVVQKQKETPSTADQSTDEVKIEESENDSSPKLYHKAGTFVKRGGEKS